MNLSHLQKSGWMSGNPTSSPFSRWNEVYGGSMERNSSSEIGRSGEADRRSRLLQVAHLNEIKNEALHLPEGDRANLAQDLLISLDLPSQDEVADDWLLEAWQRAKVLDKGIVPPISAEEVRRKAQALLR